MKPALTAEQWAEVKERRADDSGARFADLAEGTDNYEHALAAMALDGQPFGFTREDVDRLRMLLSAFHYENHVRDWLPALTDRIEALLPPEG